MLVTRLMVLCWSSAWPDFNKHRHTGLPGHSVALLAGCRQSRCCRVCWPCINVPFTNLPFTSAHTHSAATTTCTAVCNAVGCLCFIVFIVEELASSCWPLLCCCPRGVAVGALTLMMMRMMTGTAQA